jgi:hypothetical protein
MTLIKSTRDGDAIYEEWRTPTRTYIFSGRINTPEAELAWLAWRVAQRLRRKRWEDRGLERVLAAVKEGTNGK